MNSVHWYLMILNTNTFMKNKYCDELDLVKPKLKQTRNL